MLKNKFDFIAPFWYKISNQSRKSEKNMNYQGSITSGSAVVAGVAVLPKTGEGSILRYVTVATIVTGVILLILQIVVIWQKRRRR